MGPHPQRRHRRARRHEERLAFIYDRRRVQPSGLAGEIVLPPTPSGDPTRQFARTPYLVGFHCGGEPVTLLTAHIHYGSHPEGRLEEIQALANYIAGELILSYRGRAGAIDFARAVYREMHLGDMSYRISDHFPLWVEFGVDRSEEQMAVTLGVDPGMPDPLGTVPD